MADETPVDGRCVVHSWQRSSDGRAIRAPQGRTGPGRPATCQRHAARPDTVIASTRSLSEPRFALRSSAQSAFYRACPAASDGLTGLRYVQALKKRPADHTLPAEVDGLADRHNRP